MLETLFFASDENMSDVLFLVLRTLPWSLKTYQG
jgi:hypothetical protein